MFWVTEPVVTLYDLPVRAVVPVGPNLAGINLEVVPFRDVELATVVRRHHPRLVDDETGASAFEDWVRSELTSWSGCVPNDQRHQVLRLVALICHLLSLENLSAGGLQQEDKRFLISNVRVCVVD